MPYARPPGHTYFESVPVTMALDTKILRKLTKVFHPVDLSLYPDPDSLCTVAEVNIDLGWWLAAYANPSSVAGFLDDALARTMRGVEWNCYALGDAQSAQVAETLLDLPLEDAILEMMTIIPRSTRAPPSMAHARTEAIAAARDALIYTTGFSKTKEPARAVIAAAYIRESYGPTLFGAEAERQREWLRDQASFIWLGLNVRAAGSKPPKGF